MVAKQHRLSQHFLQSSLDIQMQNLCSVCHELQRLRPECIYSLMQHVRHIITNQLTIHINVARLMYIMQWMIVVSSPHVDTAHRHAEMLLS